MAMTLPTLFPKGFPTTGGWHPDLADTRGKKASLRAWWCHWLHERIGKPAPHHLLHRKATQEWMARTAIDCKMNALQHVARDQQDLRINAAANVAANRAAGHNQGINDSPSAREGKATVVPSSCVGGKRWHGNKKRQMVGNTLARGPVTEFTTMTCNSNAPGLQRALDKGCSSADRPDVGARHFAMQQQEHEGCWIPVSLLDRFRGGPLPWSGRSEGSRTFTRCCVTCAA